MVEDVRSEARATANAPIQNYTEPKAKKGPMFRESHPEMPYSGGGKVEYPSGGPSSLQPGLVPGGDNRILVFMGRTEQKTQTKKGQEKEKDNDSIIAEKRNIGNIQESGSTQNPGVTAKWGRGDWSWYTDYNYWYGMPNWHRNQGHPVQME